MLTLRGLRRVIAVPARGTACRACGSRKCRRIERARLGISCISSQPVGRTSTPPNRRCSLDELLQLRSRSFGRRSTVRHGRSASACHDDAHGRAPLRHDFTVVEQGDRHCPDLRTRGRRTARTRYRVHAVSVETPLSEADDLHRRVAAELHDRMTESVADRSAVDPDACCSPATQPSAADHRCRCLPRARARCARSRQCRHSASRCRPVEIDYLADRVRGARTGIRPIPN